MTAARKTTARAVIEAGVVIAGIALLAAMAANDYAAYQAFAADCAAYGRRHQAETHVSAGECWARAHGVLRTVDPQE